MSAHNQIGVLTRSLPVPPQANDPDITVVRLDLHESGFVVRCRVGGGRSLTPGGLAALDLRDGLGTSYQRAEVGGDFISYVPAIPAEAAWLKVGTRPETHIDLGQLR